MKNIKIEIKWAIIFVAMMLLWMLLEKMAGLHDENIEKHKIFTNFVAIPAIVLYVIALLDKRKNHYGGKISFKQGFISGLIITTIVTLFSPLTQYITVEIITPEYFTNMIEYTVNEEIYTLEKAESVFNLKSYIIQSLLFTPVMGVITTLIVAFGVKNTKS